MGNTQNAAANTGDDSSVQQLADAAEMLSDYDENTINRGTLGRPKPLLKFHTVCGTNIRLLRDGRVARRRESFCKGLAFSNRPISIDEIVCIRLCEVGTNWSGVMRFGVTNVDPASFRDIELPKFACPDLTSKGGYWAKSLAERYSVENTILHFFINESGEMYYGVNGVHKGLFLSGINVLSPLWVIVDIYGNSIAVEFVDPSEFPNLQRRGPAKPTRPIQAAIFESASTEGSPVPAVRNLQQQQQAGMTGSISANNLLNTATSSRSPSSRTSPSSGTKMRFHSVKGLNVNLQHDDTVAIRKHGEYYLGYVFSERPVKIGEKLIVLVSMTEDAFSGSLAFGLTSCDPTQVPASRLPADSDELLERPEYWVGIKDVGAMPQVGDKLSFQVDAAGRVLFSKNDAPPRVIMHVDISIPLWAFFDLYGSTRKIQILDLDQPTSNSLGISDLARNFRASSEGACSHSTVVDRSSAGQSVQQPRLNRPSSTQWNMDSLRVALPAETSVLSSTPPIQQQPEAIALPVTSTAAASSSTGASSSAPSSSAPFSLGIDPNELAKIRASITMRRLNQQQQAINAELGLSSSSATPTTTANAATANTSTVSASSGGADSSRLMSSMLDRPLPSLSERPLPSLSELLARRRSRETQSPGRYGSGGLSHLFESANTTNSGASITVPLLPPPLFSSLDVSSSYEARQEQQNRRNRAAEFEASLHRSSDSDNSPNRQADDGAQPTTEEDRNNECSICMNNRVNAVIYRCGHMCMCFPCAKETHRRSGDCPICRTPIIDVIRCYPV